MTDCTKRGALLAALLLASGPALAEPATIYRELAATKSSDAVWERSFAAMIDRAKIAFLADPTIVRGEARCPGLIDAILSATAPLMRQRHFASREVLRTGMARILSEGLTEAQAREALAFYRSPEGQFLMELGADSNNYDEGFTVTPERLDREAFDGDLARTHDAIRNNLDPKLAERAERQLGASHWYHPYLKIHPQIQDLRFAISKTKPPAEETARIDQATKRAAIQHFVNCGETVPVRTP
jgi:hypothetical protein